MVQRVLKVTAKLNFFIFVVAMLTATMCLVLASSASSIAGLIVAATVFSFVGNTLFSLMHEAVHGYLFSDRVMNERAGFILAAFFPTSFTFQRAMHLGHHRRNRTDAEMFDLYYPEDSKFLKWAQLYGIFTGPYWLLVPLSATLVALFPWLNNPSVKARLNWHWLERTGIFAMMSGLSRVDMRSIQVEVIGAILLHVSFFYFLGTNSIGWLSCYLAFAVSWGALQYADHAFSVRDIRNGAWNLRVSLPIQMIFLNYHLHLAHHQNPQVPWFYLPRFVQDGERQPTFWQIFLAMLKGPRPVEHSEPLKLDHNLDKELSFQARSVELVQK